LIAKKDNGKFILRIEDTDRERFVTDAVESIEKGMEWLGLKNNGEVVYQSDRLPVYQKYAKVLLDKGLAYKCFCTKERLEQLKKEQESAGKPPVYDRKCCDLSQDKIEEMEKDNLPYVIRFKIPTQPKEISWSDKIRDKVTIATETLEDFIIIKSDNWPTYNFANVIDDHEQGFNLIIRGDEFVPSTPKHILLYNSFNWLSPQFAHVPVIVGTDMKKLSKRNGDVALSEYRNKGYLPEAMINFLVLLGWNPGTTEEVFSLNELEKIYSIDRVGKSPAVFDIERLNWLNGVWIRKLTVKELADRIIRFNPKFENINQELLEKIVTVEQSRLKTLAEFEDISGFYFNLPKYNKNTLVFKKSSSEASKNGLKTFWESVSTLTDEKWTNMSVDDFNRLLSDAVTKNNLQNADVYWPVRVALSGEDKSPSPAELLWVFGKKESLNRLNKGLKELS
jgi:glutamyl-tRNA synthetase